MHGRISHDILEAAAAAVTASQVRYVRSQAKACTTACKPRRLTTFRYPSLPKTHSVALVRARNGSLIGKNLTWVGT